MSKKSFVIIILIIIFSVFVVVPVKEVLIHFGIVNFYKGDNWRVVNKSSNPIYDKVISLEANIENRFNNYFPFYNKINNAYYSINSKIDGIYLNDVYLKDNNDNEHMFLDKENNFYYLVNHYNSDELDKRLNAQAEFYNNIKNIYPNIDLMVYLPLRYSETSFKNVNDVYDKIISFTNKLNSNIKYSVFDSKSTDEYLKYFYKTDHHYNSFGAEKVYLDILNKYGLDNNITINHKVIRDKYYGSMAKSILSTNVVDNLWAIDTRVILDNNIKDKNFKPLKIENKNDIFYDYYVRYFNGQYDEIIYTNNSFYNRNLLIICDSLAWQIDYLLASNFDNTYVINMKYGKWKNNDLMLGNYIKKHNITHILFLREAKNIVFDADNFNLDRRVVR